MSPTGLIRLLNAFDINKSVDGIEIFKGEADGVHDIVAAGTGGVAPVFCEALPERKAGIDMVFGPLADVDVVGFSFAINVLPIIIFFAALMSVLYHLRVMEWIVKLVGGFLHKVIGTGAVESMNAAANVFVGQTEAPLAIKPYLSTMPSPSCSS